jgi:hypothetical protein
MVYFRNAVHRSGVFVVVGFGVLEGVGEGLAVEGVLTSSHPASCGQSQTSNSLLKWSRFLQFFLLAVILVREVIIKILYYLFGEMLYQSRISFDLVIIYKVGTEFG